MPSIVVHGLKFDTDDYTSAKLITFDNPSRWNCTVTPTLITGSGINVHFSIKSLSTGNQEAAFSMTVPNGFNTTLIPRNLGYETASGYNWRAFPIVERQSEGISVASGGTNENFWFTQGAYPGTFKIPFLSLDDGNNVISTVSWTWGFPLFFMGHIPYTNGTGTYNTLCFPGQREFYIGIEQNIERAPVDWFASGEQRDFDFFVRVCTGISPTSWLATIGPYRDWYLDHFSPSLPAKLTGRVLAINTAQSEQWNNILATGDNPRRYWAFNPITHNIADNTFVTFDRPNVHPERASGFANLLYAVADHNKLKANGFKHILMWATAGIGGEISGVSIDYIPSVFSNLPLNLKNTVSEIADWENRTGLEMMFYAGLGLRAIQNGSYNSVPETALASGYYKYYLNVSGFWDLPRAGKWALSNSGINQFNLNFSSGIFAYSHGVGLDACSDPVSDPWCTGYFRYWKQTFPNSHVAGEGVGSDVRHAFIDNIYFPQESFKGRCVFLDSVASGYAPWVLVQFFNNFVQGSTGTYDQNLIKFWDRIDEIESQGAYPIILVLSNDDLQAAYTRPFKYLESELMTNTTDFKHRNIDKVFTHQGVMNSDFTVNKSAVHQALDKSYASGHEFVIFDVRDPLYKIDQRDFPWNTVELARSGWVDLFYLCKQYRPGLEIGSLEYPMLKNTTDIITMFTGVVSGYQEWLDALDRINQKWTGPSSFTTDNFYQYVDFFAPDLQDYYGNSAEALTIYDTWAVENLIQTNTKLAQNKRAVFPNLSQHFLDTYEFAGKTWDISHTQLGISICKSNATGVLFSGGNRVSNRVGEFTLTPVSTGIAQWQAIVSGCIVLKLAGIKFDTSGLNFSTDTTLNQVAIRLQTAINTTINNTTLTLDQLPYPYLVGSVLTKWNGSSFTFSLLPNESASGSEFPFDSAILRTWISFDPTGISKYTNIYPTPLGTLTSFNNELGGIRNHDEFNNWAAPANWWNTFLENADPFPPCREMWPETMWSVSMWNMLMWPLCYIIFTFPTQGCVVFLGTIDLISKCYQRSVDLLSKGLLGNIDLVSTCQLESNLVSIGPYGEVNLINSANFETDLISSCTIETNLISSIILPIDLNMSTSCTLETDLIYKATIETNLLNICQNTAEIINRCTIPLDLCIICSSPPAIETNHGGGNNVAVTDIIVSGGEDS